MGCDQETVRAAEKIILPGDRDRLGCVTQIRVRATCQRDEFSLCTSKFESDHPSHAVGLADVAKCNSVLPVSLLFIGGDLKPFGPRPNDRRPALQSDCM